MPMATSSAMPEPVDLIETEARLNACVPHLMQTANQWEAYGLIDAPLLIAAATPRSCTMVRGDGWPVVDDDAFTAQQAAAAVISAVESEATPEACTTIAAGVAILIKAKGRAAHLEDAIQLRREGKIPVLIAMVADPETMTMTTAGVPRPTMH